MLCRINLYQQIYRPCYQLYAQKKCTEYHLNLSPDDLIEITIEKRLLNSSVCFPKPDTKKSLKAFIYQHIKGSALDCSKSERENVENIDSLDIGTGSTELLVIFQDLLETIDNEIESIPNQQMRERVQKLFEALKNGEIDFTDTDQKNAQQLGITPRQYKFCRDQYFKPIVQSLITHEEFKEFSAKMTEIHIEPNNENDCSSI
jgi:DNA-directed RNA polymerase specialized sigma24 family protein